MKSNRMQYLEEGRRLEREASAASAASVASASAASSVSTRSSPRWRRIPVFFFVFSHQSTLLHWFLMDIFVGKSVFYFVFRRFIFTSIRSIKEEPSEINDLNEIRHRNRNGKFN